MAQLLIIPFPLRLIVVMVVAAVVATWLNAAIYAFSWQKRSFSPWQSPPSGMPPRTWLDRVPIVGWWRLRREHYPEAPQHWVRPLLIEILFPALVGWLYWWETAQYGLVAQQGRDLGMVFTDFASLGVAVHTTFLFHALLMALVLVASMIDFDEFYIPDYVTYPGTLVGLVLATLLPLGLLPQIEETAIALSPSVSVLDRWGSPVVGPLGSPLVYHPVHVGSQGPWPTELAARPNMLSLVVALGSFWLWCFSFLRRRWLKRRPFNRRLRYWILRIMADWNTFPFREVTLLGSLAIVGVWWWGGGAWVGLVTSLVGLAASGGAIWLIRLLAGAAMQREAMGFGDVLLMMLVGAFVGWQASIMIFFVAPFVALFYAAGRLIVHHQREVPYGPFLGMGALVVIVAWDSLWLRFGLLFDVPWLIPGVMVVCLVLCGLMLWVLQGLKRLF